MILLGVALPAKGGLGVLPAAMGGGARSQAFAGIAIIAIVFSERTRTMCT